MQICWIIIVIFFVTLDSYVLNFLHKLQLKSVQCLNFVGLRCWAFSLSCLTLCVIGVWGDNADPTPPCKIKWGDSP